MKKSILSIGKILLPTLLVLVFSIVTLLPIPVVTKMNPKTTIYLDPPTINGTVIGQEFTVNLTIRDAPDMNGWAAGMIFNATLLNCTGFKQGEFVSDVGSTLWLPAEINNTAGVIGGHGCVLTVPDVYARDDGRLAYLTFKVKAPGLSDIHLRDVEARRDLTDVPINIIDVYTAVVDTTAHTVVTVSNSTGKTGWYHSGFYNHAFSPTFKTLSFNVTGPKLGFSNVTIPKALLPPPELPIEWKVVIDGNLVDRTVTANDTHTSIYFTYTAGIHEVQITPRMSSIILIALSSTLIFPEENVTISGNITAENQTGRPNVNVTILNRLIGEELWHTAGQNQTDQNSNYTFTWTPERAGTYEIKTSWEGDENTLGDESDVLSLPVVYVFEVEGLKVFIETNSTVVTESFNFSRPFKQISFNVTIPQGKIGFFNVTLPKKLLNVSTLDEWKVIIDDVPPLKTEERTVTENATHYFIYFTYAAGIHEVQITTRMMSTISMDVSEDSINLGSSVTISGSINPMNRSASVTIRYKIWESGENWITLDTVTTDTNGNYTYPWTPGTGAIYYVMARWEGDEIFIGAKSDEKNLTVVQSSTISIALSSANVSFGSSVTISGTIDSPKPSMPVTIRYRESGQESWSSAGQNYTDQNGEYTFTWEPHKVITPDNLGTHEVKAEWLGFPYPPPPDPFILGAESDVLTITVKWSSTISIALSSANITKGKSVTISGNITVADNIARADVNATISYRLSGAADWTTLTTVETDESGNYTYPWKPDAAGTYDVKASWDGDDVTFGNESDVLTLTVEKAAAGIPMEIVIVAVVAIVVIAAVVVYFVKFRKP